MNNYRKPFFSGRNGADELSVTLVVISVIVFLAAPIFDEKYIQGIFLLLGGILFVLGILRSFSTNIGKRRHENQVFLDLFRAETKEEKERRKKEEEEKREREKLRKERRKEEEKTHAFFRCPQCGKELRVPKGKGKIKIRCPNCSHEFIRKS